MPPSCHTGLVPDPYFRDSSKWLINAAQGSASVSGGVLTLTDFRGTVVPVTEPAPVAGNTYYFEVNCLSHGSGPGLAIIQFADTFLWTENLGTWDFIEPTEGDGLGLFGGGFIAGTNPDWFDPLSPLTLAVAFDIVNASFSKIDVVCAGDISGKAE
jgi:hypothetical protein